MMSSANQKDNIETVPARSGRAVRLDQGQSIKIINTHGHQVVDFWALSSANSSEYLSMEHLRATNTSVFPQPGDTLVTNRRRPILTFVEDTSPGVHDTLMAACDAHRYKQLGCKEYHDSCTDNFYSALKEARITPVCLPSPFNIWMNIPLSSDGSLSWGEPVSKPGDYVVFRAELNCVVVMSCCPQDLIPVNSGNPTEVHYQILG